MLYVILYVNSLHTSKYQNDNITTYKTSIILTMNKEIGLFKSCKLLHKF